uniref:Deoxyribonuclease-2-alpha n=1 Tax=Neogobius melanostomus TaxID=47308 RepID=A0A8C6SBD8_9GOBI
MLRSVRDMPATFGFISYNDQPPGCSSDKKYGHSKGVVMGDSRTGTALWLPHSTPKFPLRRNPQRFWPLSGNKNAQTFMCVSLTYNDLSAIGTHLQHIRALPFDYDLPGNFPVELRNAVDKVYSKSHWISLSKDRKVQDLRTRIDQTLMNQGAGAELKLIAKRNAESGAGDLYRQLAEQLDPQGGVKAQSWRCGKDYKYDRAVFNIKKSKQM